MLTQKPPHNNQTSGAKPSRPQAVWSQEHLIPAPPSELLLMAKATAPSHGAAPLPDQPSNPESSLQTIKPSSRAEAPKEASSPTH